MNTNPTQPAPSDPIESRLRRLERTNARWRAAAIAGLAGAIGVLIGGMGNQPLAPSDYQYMTTDDTIYRMDRAGNFEYIKFENGRRSANGYFTWGPVQIDKAYKNLPRPQP